MYANKLGQDCESLTLLNDVCRHVFSFGDLNLVHFQRCTFGFMVWGLYFLSAQITLSTQEECEGERGEGYNMPISLICNLLFGSPHHFSTCDF